MLTLEKHELFPLSFSYDMHIHYFINLLRQLNIIFM